MAILLTFRDSIRKICPPWLQTGLAEKIMYSIGAHFDATIDGLVAGIKLRFPGMYSDESLGLIGQDRRIRRGRTDTNESYANRLRGWLNENGHPTRGGPYAMLGQLHAHFAPNNFQIELIYRSGRRFTMDADGVIVMDDTVFSPDSQPEKWARWWLYYTWPTPVGKRHWGDGGKWGDGGVWGSDLTPADVADLRVVPREWNAAHAFGHIILLTADEDVQVSLGEWNAG